MPRSRFPRIAALPAVVLFCARTASAGPTPPPPVPAPPAAAPAGIPASSPANAPALGAFLAGTVAGRLGDDPAAAAFMRTALAVDPDDPALRHSAFTLSALSGSPAAAALAATVPPDLLSTLVLANEAARTGDWHRAVSLLRRLPGDPLGSTVAPPLLGWAEAGAGDTAAALLSFGHCAAPLASSCLVDAGTVAELAHQPDQAARFYDQARSRYGIASLAALQTAGSFYVRHGNRPAAEAMLATLVERVPVLGMVRDRLLASLDQPAVTNPAQGMARAYLGIAELIRETATAGADANPPGNAGPRESAAAVDAGTLAAGFMLRFSLVLQPDLSATLLTLADQVAPKHPDQAQALLAAVPAADPLHPLAELRGATLDAATPGGRDSAIRRLRALSDAMPGRPEPAEALADVLSDAGQWRDAIPAYDRAIADETRLAGGTLPAADWRLVFSRAVALDRADRWPEARAGLQAALALSPNQPFVLNYLGYSMVERRDDLSGATVLIRRALAAQPNDGQIRDSLGWAQLRAGQVSAAVATLEQAAEQQPEDPTVNFHLGAAYWAAGRRLEAENQWHWALGLHPDADATAQIRDALAKAGTATSQTTTTTAAPTTVPATAPATAAKDPGR